MSYYIIGGDGKTYGPKPESEIRSWIREGRLNAESNIAAESSQDWRPLKTFPEFAADLNPAAAPAVAAAPQPAVQPRVQTATQPYPQYAAAPQNRTNGMAVAGMICGIVSLLMLCCCYGIPFNILGIVFSVVGLNHAKKQPQQEGKGMAVAGLICGIISVLVAIAFLTFGIALSVFQP